MDNKIDWKQFWHYCFNRKVKTIPLTFLAILVMCATVFIETLDEANASAWVGIAGAILAGVGWLRDLKDIYNPGVDSDIYEDSGKDTPEIPIFLDPDFSKPYDQYNLPLARNHQKNELLDLLYRSDLNNDIVVLYGPSGCGKSHLLKLLVQGGSIRRKDGIDVQFVSESGDVDILRELKDVPCVYARVNCETYQPVLLIDQSERLPIRNLVAAVQGVLSNRKVVIAVTDTNFGDVFSAMKQLAGQNNCSCVAYYLALSTEDIKAIRDEQERACEGHNWSADRKSALAVAAYARFALEANRIPLIQYRFIWALFQHAESNGVLVQEGNKLRRALRNPEDLRKSLLADLSPVDLIHDENREHYLKLESELPISNMIAKVTEAYFMTLEQVWKNDTYKLPFYEMLQFLADGTVHGTDDIALLTFTKKTIVQNWLKQLTERSLIRQVGNYQFVSSHQWVASLFHTMSQAVLSGDHRDQVEAVTGRFPHYLEAISKANKNYHKGSDKWGDGIASLCSIATILLTGTWITIGTRTFPEILLRVLTTLCLYVAVVFFTNFIRYNACICKPAINRLLFFPVILIGLLPSFAFLIPGMEKLEMFWMVLLGIDNASIGIYFLLVHGRRAETAKKYFKGKGVEFIIIGAVLCIYGLLTGLWQMVLVEEAAAVSGVAQLAQVSLPAFPCIAYLTLITLAIYNYCSPQFLPSLRLKACMIENEDFQKQHVI